MKSEEKITSHTQAERRAYYMGYGAGLCGITVTNPIFLELAESFSEKELLSLISGLLNGNAKQSK